MSARSQAFSPESVVAARSGRMRDVFDFVTVIADGDSSVLISGESGTGKELIAHLIHASSPRRHGPFVVVSGAMLTETLIESELFGHEGGTVFLDDIDTVPISAQVKLLQALPTRTGMRVIAGTTRDLHTMVAAGEFREDLFYRLSVIPIHLPPLRDRAEDIPALAEHFLSRYFRERHKPVRPLSPAMRAAFLRHSWPGNVRELENVCERIAQTCICNTVGVGCVPWNVLFQAPPKPAASIMPADALRGSLDERLQALESQLIVSALCAAHGNKSKAAALLQIKRSTLGDRIRKLGLVDADAALAGTA